MLLLLMRQSVSVAGIKHKSILIQLSHIVWKGSFLMKMAEIPVGVSCGIHNLLEEEIKF